jgi:hypothetical protein
MQQEIAHLSSDLVGRCGHFTLALAEGTALLLQRFRPSRIAIATQLTNHFGQTVHLRSKIVPFGGNLPTLFVEFGHLSEVAQGPFVAAAGKRVSNSVVVGTDSANVDHGSEP